MLRCVALSAPVQFRSSERFGQDGNGTPYSGRIPLDLSHPRSVIPTLLPLMHVCHSYSQESESVAGVDPSSFHRTEFWAAGDLEGIISAQIILYPPATTRQQASIRMKDPSPVSALWTHPERSMPGGKLTEPFQAPSSDNGTQIQ